MFFTLFGCTGSAVLTVRCNPVNGRNDHFIQLQSNLIGSVVDVKMTDEDKRIAEEIDKLMSDIEDIEDKASNFSDDSIDPQIEYDIIINETSGLTDGFVNSLLGTQVDDADKEVSQKKDLDQDSTQNKEELDPKDSDNTDTDDNIKTKNKKNSETAKKPKKSKFVCPINSKSSDTKSEAKADKKKKKEKIDDTNVTNDNDDSAVNQEDEPKEVNNNTEQESRQKDKKTKKKKIKKNNTNEEKVDKEDDTEVDKEVDTEKKSVSKKSKPKKPKEKKTKEKKPKKDKSDDEKRDESSGNGKNKRGPSFRGKRKRDTMYSNKKKRIEISPQMLEDLFGKRGEPLAEESVQSLAEYESMYSKQCDEWFRRELRHKNYDFKVLYQ